MYRPAGRLREELRRQQRPAGVAVAAVPLVDQLQRLAERAEDDRVLADVVADADGVDADLVRRPLADQPLAAVDELRLPMHLLDDLGELQGRAAGRVLLEAVVPLDDLDVEALALERLGRLPRQLEQHVDDQAHVRREQDRGLVRRGLDLGLLRRGVAGRGDDERDLPVDARPAGSPSSRRARRSR